MCTVFTGIESQCYLLGKNYDCFADGGMVFTNKRKVKRKSLVLSPEKELEWVSQFGSVTFSQSGKGMPVCGVNEKGLIVEQATFPATVYPDTTEKEHISSTRLMEELDYGKSYEYAHDYENKLTRMQCLPDALVERRYYCPTSQGAEREVRERLEEIREWKSK